MPIVKKQSNLIAIFCEASILMPYKRVSSKLSINYWKVNNTKRKRKNKNNDFP